MSNRQRAVYTLLIPAWCAGQIRTSIQRSGFGHQNRTKGPWSILRSDFEWVVRGYTSAALSFHLPVRWHNSLAKNTGKNAMSDLENCRAMELMYLQRAKLDPPHSGKWLERAERWAEHGRREARWLVQQRIARQQMHAGAMAMAAYTVSGDSRSKQLG